MRSIYPLMLVFCLLAMAANGQETQLPLLNIGDAAPPLRMRGWLKGAPIRGFERGKVYVVELWATWCGPCKAAMPHLSQVAGRYRGAVTVIGVDVMETARSMNFLRAFVDSMGSAMDFSVAAEDGNFMTRRWLNAAEVPGIPTAFVINQGGRVAWIGHPNFLADILPEILNNSLDIDKASLERKRNLQWKAMDDSAGNELRDYRADLEDRHLEKSDSLLLIRIDEIVGNKPALKYAPSVANFTFNALLKTDPQKAYEYGKVFLVTSTYRIPPYYIIFNSIRSHSEEQELPSQIYELGIEAYQARIDFLPKTISLPTAYNIMADWYLRTNDTTKAIETQEKAIEALKTEKRSSADTLAAFESRLQVYKNLAGKASPSLR